MWRYLWERRPVRPGLESARRFIALKDFIIKTAVLVISRLLIILVYCVGVTQCAQRWFCILQDCAKYDLLYYSLLFFFFAWQGRDKHPFSRSRLSTQPAANTNVSRSTWSAASHWTCKEPGNVSLLLTKQSLLWSCNRKPWAETSPGLPVRNL